MKRLICSVRCDNCASISGTLSGIGSGISPGSTPPAAGAEGGGGAAAGAGDGGAGTAFDAGALGAGFGAGVVPAAPVVVTGAIGSFEYSGKVKSKWFSGAAALNFSFAASSAGNASLP